MGCALQNGTWAVVCRRGGERPVTGGLSACVTAAPTVPSELNFSVDTIIIWLAVRDHMSSPESKFLEEMRNKEQYSGQWIAILDARIVANGRNITDVYAKAAKSAKGKTPLFVEIPDKNKEQTLIL